SLGVWYAPSKNRQPTAPILFASFSSEKLSTNGKVVYAGGAAADQRFGNLLRFKSRQNGGAAGLHPGKGGLSPASFQPGESVEQSSPGGCLDRRFRAERENCFFLGNVRQRRNLEHQR